MILFLIFVFGLMIGSFLNVVALRLPQGESFSRGRSHCFFCQKILHWFELIPVLSFLWQGGRCRGCQKNIPWRYVLVEIITGGLFAGVYYFLIGQDLKNFWPLLVFSLIIISVLEIIFLIDLKEGVIPDILIWPFIVLALVFWCLNGGNIFNYFLTGLCLAAFFALQYLVSSGRWVGLGDIGLGFLIGVFLGFPKAAAALLFAYIGGAIIGIFLIILKKKSWVSSVPLAVFLVPATIFALFWGEKVINWYLDILGRI